MRVLYNGTPLMAPRTGVGRYVVNLCRAIVEVDRSVECDFVYLFSIRRGLGETGDPARAAARNGFSTRLFVQRFLFGTPLVRLYPFALDASFRLRTRGRGYDLYHETNYVPRPFGGPTAVTVYDLSLVFHPETHPEHRVYLFRRDFARRMPRVDRFLAISHAVKEELIAELGIEPDRVTVTHLGVDRDVFRPLDPGERLSQLAGFSDAGEPRPELARFSDAVGRDLRGGYLLFVGSLEPRKNLTTLVEAYARLPAAIRSTFPIVIAGPRGWKFEPVRERIRGVGIERDLLWTGFVAEAELAALYRGATALAFPSLYEGFGLPPLEAMACGTPVVCSDLPSLREVTGGAALRLPPRNVEAWLEGLRRILDDADLRERLRAEGLRRAERFSWRRCAEETLTAYRALVA